MRTTFQTVANWTALFLVSLHLGTFQEYLLALNQGFAMLLEKADCLLDEIHGREDAGIPF